MSAKIEIPASSKAPFRATDLSGARYGRLTVVAKAAEKRGRHTAWICRCDCGAETVVSRHSLTSGNTNSCGCYNKDINAARFLKHGQHRNPAYHCWQAVKNRCLRPGSAGYEDYGGRGITMCPEWRDDFAAFLRDMGPRPSRRHSVDRIDNDGDYEPSNCRWATQSEQNLNQRRTVFVEVSGELATVHELAAAAGLPSNLVKRRLRRGLSLQRALDPKRYGARDPTAPNAEELRKQREAHALRRSAAH